MSQKQRLELTWIGKDARPKLEPRVLLEDPTKSHHAKQRVTDHDIFDNRLIFGDNLLALSALEQEFAGKVKCVFIYPPFDTGSTFAHYDDGAGHLSHYPNLTVKKVLKQQLPPCEWGHEDYCLSGQFRSIAERKQKHEATIKDYLVVSPEGASSKGRRVAHA